MKASHFIFLKAVQFRDPVFVSVGSTTPILFSTAMMNVRTIAQVAQTGRAATAGASLTTMRRAYANLAYNATSSQPTSGEVPTLDRKLDSLEERIQARRDALAANNNTNAKSSASDDQSHSETSSTLEASQAPKKGIMSILPGMGKSLFPSIHIRARIDIIIMTSMLKHCN